MITIVEANSKKLLKKFVKFPFSLYKNHPYWVPPLINDELETFDKTKNPAWLPMASVMAWATMFAPASAAKSALNLFLRLRETARSMVIVCKKATVIVQRTTRTKSVVTKAEPFL